MRRLHCDGCTVIGAELTECDHRSLCPDCVAESRCRACYVEARDEIGATW